MNPPRIFPFLALVTLAAGCGSDQHRLDKARETWNANGSQSYYMTVTQNCFCPDVFPVDIEVAAGGVRAALVHSSYGELELEASEYLPWFTVEGLFNEIQIAINDEAHEIDVEYAETLGYPRSIQIDWVQLASDDEVGWTIEGLKIDPAGQGGR